MSATLTAFLRNACEGRDASVRVRDLYRAYAVFCAGKRLHPVRRKGFARRLARAGYPCRHHADGTTWVDGLELCARPGLPPPPKRPMLVLPDGLTFEDVSALSLVASEVARQRTVKGFTPAHDDAACPVGELETAGGEYLIHAGYRQRDKFPPGCPSADSWPWDAKQWKPESPMSDATRGCALGVAGIALRLRRGERVEG